jgi:5-histidylcysteine sulfoxide synthase
MNNLSGKHEPLNLKNCTKENIINYFNSAWQTEDILFKTIINPDTFYVNPDLLRNYLIFYLGHSAVFYINKLIIVGLLEKRINPDYEQLFEVGVDPATPEELQNEIASVKWDTVPQIWSYRNQAYQTIIKVIETTPLSLPINADNPWWAIIMGIEHQRIHIETSSMLIRQLACDLVEKPASWHYASSQTQLPLPEMIEIEGGLVTLGHKMDNDLYGWDVDFGEKEVEVKPFAVGKYMVTNAEFLEFVQAGGYDNPGYWSQQAWRWKEQYQIKHPKFWLSNGEQYNYRALFDELELPLDFPVEVNHYEANAYCTYLSQKLGENFRLMSEAEWHLASQGSQRMSDYNLNFKVVSPHPVGSLITAKSDAGIYDLRGNVWEWLGDIFQPLSGFKPHFLYADYSAPFFDNQHYLLAGGAWATNGYEATAFYRNWFRPYFYQHAGFRLAQTIK